MSHASTAHYEPSSFEEISKEGLLAPKRLHEVPSAPAEEFPTKSLCNLCGKDTSRYICKDCGCMHMCHPCCIRMHRNAYLNGHEVSTVKNTDGQFSSSFPVASLWEKEMEALHPPPPATAVPDMFATHSTAQRTSSDKACVMHPMCGVETQRGDESYLCQIHRLHAIELWCVTCSVAVCMQCVQFGEVHAKCTVTEIQNQLFRERKLLKENALELNTLQELLKTKRVLFLEHRESSRGQQEGAFEALQLQLNRIRMAIQDAEALIKSTFQNITHRKNNAIEQSILEVDECISVIQKFVNNELQQSLQKIELDDDIMDLLPSRVRLIEISENLTRRGRAKYDEIQKSLDDVQRFILNHHVPVEPILESIHECLVSRFEIFERDPVSFPVPITTPAENQLGDSKRLSCGREHEDSPPSLRKGSDSCSRIRHWSHGSSSRTHPPYESTTFRFVSPVDGVERGKSKTAMQRTVFLSKPRQLSGARNGSPSDRLRTTSCEKKDRALHGMSSSQRHSRAHVHTMSSTLTRNEASRSITPNVISTSIVQRTQYRGKEDHMSPHRTPLYMAEEKNVDAWEPRDLMRDKVVQHHMRSIRIKSPRRVVAPIHVIRSMASPKLRSGTPSKGEQHKTPQTARSPNKLFS